jgi:hypothetical protein
MSFMLKDIKGAVVEKVDFPDNPTHDQELLVIAQNIVIEKQSSVSFRFNREKIMDIVNKAKKESFFRMEDAIADAIIAADKDIVERDV